MRETVPENDVASLQEELAAAKLREAEANLALKDLKSKVAELSSMWKKHLQQKSESDNTTVDGALQTTSVVPSTPKKLLGSFLEGNKSETARLEEELMTARLIEVENEAELQASRLKVMELETQVRWPLPVSQIESTVNASISWITRLYYQKVFCWQYWTLINNETIVQFQNQVIANQLKRQAEETNRFKECLETKTTIEAKLERQVREAQRKYADLESRMKEDLMMARIREAENTQCVAELTQKISSLEYKVRKIVFLPWKFYFWLYGKNRKKFPEIPSSRFPANVALPEFPFNEIKNSFKISLVFLQNQEMMAEGDLANTMDQSNKIREMQDKIANLRAQVCLPYSWILGCLLEIEHY